MNPLCSHSSPFYPSLGLARPLFIPLLYTRARMQCGEKGLAPVGSSPTLSRSLSESRALCVPTSASSTGLVLPSLTLGADVTLEVWARLEKVGGKGSKEPAPVESGKKKKVRYLL